MTISTCAVCGQPIRYGGIDEYGEIWCDSKDHTVCTNGKWHQPAMAETGSVGYKLA